MRRGALSVKRNLKACERILAGLRYDASLHGYRVTREDGQTATMQDLIDAGEYRRVHGEPRLR